MKTRRYNLDLQMFAEDQQPNPPAKPEKPSDPNPNEDYIKTIAELKANTVPKTEYDKLKKQNKELLDSVINGSTVTNEENKKSSSIEELRDSLFGNKRDENMTNLDFCSKALELREKIMEQGGADPFVPQGRKVQPSYEDYSQAERVASELKDAIAAAGGDPVAFNGELLKRGL